MRLQYDCSKQLSDILSTVGNDSIKLNYADKIKSCFSYLFIINYISKRIELRQFFDNQYYVVSYSCLIESFILLLENYPRGSALVLRSALENGLKSIVLVAGKNNYTINDRSYLANRQQLARIIENEFPDKYKSLFEKTNDQMYTQYGKLSGLSHSLTTESQNNLLEYFSDVSITNDTNLRNIFDKLSCVLDCIFISTLLISKNSLENWESSDLKEIISFVFGSKRTISTFSLFKS